MRVEGQEFVNLFVAADHEIGLAATEEDYEVVERGRKLYRQRLARQAEERRLSLIVERAKQRQRSEAPRTPRESRYSGSFAPLPEKRKKLHHNKRRFQ